MRPTQHRGENSMSAVEFDSRYQDNMRSLVRMRAKRAGVDVPAARRAVAADLHVSPSKVERAEKGRFKTVGAWLFDRVRGLVIREIENEIQRLTHELEIARQCGADPRSLDAGEIEARLAEVRGLLNVGATK